MAPTGIPMRQALSPDTYRPGLKVKNIYLKKMKDGDKKMELRTWGPSKYTPRGCPAAKVGARLFLLESGAGKLWGSAKIADVIVIGDAASFRDHYEEHRFNLDEGTELAAHLRRTLEDGGVLYGWRLDEFRWASRRLVRGEKPVPNWVRRGSRSAWAGVPLSAALEEFF